MIMSVAHKASMIDDKTIFNPGVDPGWGLISSAGSEQ